LCRSLFDRGVFLVVDVVERVVPEISRDAGDTTWEQIKLTNTRRTQTKEPHLRFDLFGLGNREESFVRTSFPWNRWKARHGPGTNNP
jgi:hypothetical protein